MRLDRREFLRGCAAAAPALATAAAARADADAAPSGCVGVIEHSYGLHAADRKARTGRSFRDEPLAFVDFCRERGADGVQIGLGAIDADSVKDFKTQLQSRPMYLEASIRLPRNVTQLDRFAREVNIAAALNVRIFRTAILEGRRYETFSTAAEFRRFSDEAFQSLELAKQIFEPAFASRRLVLAVENHKDWRVDQLVEMLKRLQTPSIGVCLDTGNNLALLEDPMEVVEALAPWAFTTHLKDLGVESYRDGFLMSEVPLGEGFLDLKRIVTVLRQARPDIHFNIEMITRDTLKTPCLTDRYWATFENVSGRDLARTLSLVRDRAGKQPLPRISGLSPEEKLKAEDDNVRRSIAYAREHLGL